MPEQRAEAARHQVRGIPARTAERCPPVLPLGFAAVAARRRREPGGVGSREQAARTHGGADARWRGLWRRGDNG